MVTERDHVSGAPNAPATLLEYGNFECIHCGRAYAIIKEVQKTKHAHASGHPVIASAEPGEQWLYCYPHDAFAEY